MRRKIVDRVDDGARGFIAASPSHPRVACILRDHMEPEVDPQPIEDDLERGCAAAMWEPGG